MMTCCSRSWWPWSSHKWLQNCLHVGFNQSKCDSYQNKCKAIAEGIMNVNDNCFFPVVRSIVHNLLINRKLCMHIWQLATQKCTMCAELFKRIGFRQQLWQDSGRRIVCLWKGWQGRFFLIAKSCCCTTICFFLLMSIVMMWKLLICECVCICLWRKCCKKLHQCRVLNSTSL